MKKEILAISITPQETLIDKIIKVLVEGSICANCSTFSIENVDRILTAEKNVGTPEIDDGIITIEYLYFECKKCNTIYMVNLYDTILNEKIKYYDLYKSINQFKKDNKIIDTEEIHNHGQIKRNSSTNFGFIRRLFK